MYLISYAGLTWDERVRTMTRTVEKITANGLTQNTPVMNNVHKKRACLVAGFS